MTTTDQAIHDQLARLRLKILEKKLDHEKDDLHSDRNSPSLDSEDDFLKLHTALLKRRQLLETLKTEKRRNEDLERPRSLPFATRRSHSPTRAHSQYSLPDVHISQPYVPTQRLEPIANPPQLPNAPIYILQQPAPPAAPSAPVNHMYPLNVSIPSAAAPVSKESFNKSDVFEMMMMQNAQMHQLIMQQMMISALPMNPNNNNKSAQRAGSSAEEPVHHHHYYSNPRPAEVAYSQPVVPVYVRQAMSELPPLQAPKARPPKPKRTRKLNLRRLRRFRKVAFAIIFVKMLRKGGQTLKVNPMSSFRLEILLKEAVGALHVLYLKREWIVHPILMSIAGPSPFNFAAALDSNQEAIRRLSETLKSLLYSVSRIMPHEGVLGTNRKSAFFSMTISGQKYPGWYFWNIEKQLLSVDPQHKTTHVGKFESQVLLVGIVVGRALVTTLLLKPSQYGLTRTAGGLQEENLKLFATLLIYILRKIYTRPGEQLGPIPEEVVSYIYNDANMSSLFSTMKRTLNYCEGILRAWTEDYYQRLSALRSFR